MTAGHPDRGSSRSSFWERPVVDDAEADELSRLQPREVAALEDAVAA
ncbi:hypothetical protein [Nakamurella sp. PAMC28650]|nr:hypothetical protein [Nakamurella sp. PAMC28650]QNK80589.1 hypothetical protein H7F38_20950 [Nakamurella sp. PAMC28650]